MHDFEADARNAASRARRREQEAAGRARPVPQAAGGDAAASLMHLQRIVGNAGVVQLLGDEASEDYSPVHGVVGKGGTPLDDATRSTMESRFGQGFSDVRIHTDDAASASAESVGANAYTVGSDIVFRSGQFDAGSPTGQRTLAHELTHVVQQRSGPVDGTDAPGGIKLSNPSDRFERAAEQTASEIVGDDGAKVQATVQRETPEDEEDEELK